MATYGTMTNPTFAASYAGDGLCEWRVAHEMTVSMDDGRLMVADSPTFSYHLLRLHSDEFLYRLVRLRIVLRAAPTADVNFYVHHVGEIHVAEIALDGRVRASAAAERVETRLLDDGALEIEVEYLSRHPTVSIGSSLDGSPVYAGSGHDQFAIISIDVGAYDAAALLSRVAEEERICLVDVGAKGGLQFKWMLLADRITPVVFEPNPEEAETVRRTLSRIPGAQIVEAALAHQAGPRTLHITRQAGCTSLRKPNMGLLAAYSAKRLFEIVKEIEISCIRFDSFFHGADMRSPDVIKIDVQGFEYEVLLGFGDLLGGCLGIELEAHFYPLYEGETTFGEIVSFLSEFGFMLRRVERPWDFDGDYIECNAFFTKTRSWLRGASDVEKRKFNLMTKVWDLAPYAI
jgi:FkbM family methyltransferase